MKIISRLLASGLIASVLCAGAQIIRTNKMGSIQALKIASRLKVGMQIRDMERFMETNGLTEGFTLGGIGYGTKVYVLSDGCSLCLDSASTRGIWTNSVLQSACIQSNGIKIQSIRLKNRP
jgi:hypothetical protein